MGRGLKAALAGPSLAILKEAHESTGEFKYVFMSTIGIGKDRPIPIGESATTNAIRRMVDPRTGKAFATGFMTSHGFRHTASTMLNELEYSSDAIELQMAHLTLNVIIGTYNKAQLMTTRVKMMTEWADYIDGLLKN